MSLSRTVALRSTLRAASRRATPRLLLWPAARRSYASQHDAAKSSDMPWLIGAVAFTVPSAAYLLYSGPSKSDHHDDKYTEENHDAEAPPADNEFPQEESNKKSDEDKFPVEQEPKHGNPAATHKPSQTGGKIAPASADNSTLAENWDDKEGHEEYRETTENKDTKAATSSSDLSSKKGSMEHPQEDPR
ncbi:uncharacterized protein BCR38DRAFT_417112 [Pseudomassariella vexata]|uniref:Uncharacterized protein n=1 Tax=Pseudomassariella vexata TaxID=1141098 RepID=A0A1Y2EJQ0_9PEZI|nr:uncharacterized protein BCR38DRAFT_417112 [Pseudomassariella vexata]ORY71524.1 hypothetical protein BCR38DRAFT_417112 [Pseudomassariella vexata]